MTDIFKDTLRERFIALIESERGIQAKLAKSIGKSNNYFSEIKRGNPVNANHLRAVGLVFGPEKVSELLGIVDNENENGTFQKDEKILNFSNNVDNQPNILNQFEDKKAALETIEDLIIIERQSFRAYEKARNIIKGIKEGASSNTEGDRRKRDLPFNPPDRRKKVG